jgi:hypothetical protein
MSNFSFITKLASILGSMAIDLACILALIMSLTSAQGDPYKQSQAFFLYVIATCVNNLTIKDES